MAKRVDQDPDSFIVPLNMNGLQGRMLYLSGNARNNKEILCVYGQHTSIEQWISLVQVLHRYGSVTMPDLPGFGGMDPMYKLDRKPTLNHLADYLAAFIKLRYKRRRITIIAIGYGLLIVTRMLQQYPDLAKRVDLIVSIGGFARHDDVKLSRLERITLRISAGLLSNKIIAWSWRLVMLHPFFLKEWYSYSQNYEMNTTRDAESFSAFIAMQTKLWQQNDLRTRARSIREVLLLDNCQVRVNAPVWHVSGAHARLVNEQLAEQHLQVVFTEYHQTKTNAQLDDIVQLSNPTYAAKLLPLKIRQQLRQM